MGKDRRGIAKYAGAYIVWLIGSGFATGQEVLRFFASYGYGSYAVVLVNLVGLLAVGLILMLTGYRHQKEADFHHFKHYCGKKLGTVYALTVPVLLFSLMTVLFSAAGSTLSEYYGVNHYIGAALMCGMVLATYLIGFERFLQIVSKIGPLVIIFCILVGIISVVRDFHNIKLVSSYEGMLSLSRACPHWLLSAVLYLSLNFVTGSAYYTNLGASAKREREAKWGGIIGSFILISAIGIMNTAILLNGENTALLAIPTLFLAKKINLFFGAAFSVILILGMYASCSATMWSVCHSIFPKNSGKNKIAAGGIAGCALVVGLFPFTRLVGIIFPLIGYYGLPYLACVLYRGGKDYFRARGQRKNGRS